MEEYREKNQDTENTAGKAGQPGKNLSVDQLSDSAFYRMYLREIRSRTVVSGKELEQLYRRLADGDRSVLNDIVDNWLMRIVEIARIYQDSAVLIEDVIQEGNMGLWMALDEIPGGMDPGQTDTYLLGKVKEAMENYIREVCGEIDQEQAVVAKAALLYSAREHLAGENGEDPSLRQLSEFTHIPAEEIEDIFALMKNQED